MPQILLNMYQLYYFLIDSVTYKFERFIKGQVAALTRLGYAFALAFFGEKYLFGAKGRLISEQRQS